ncbi:hypothetical protein AMECASPLE_035709 [Ameca splendens]|uniref:Uncharacterized protein n=1 Tax=Ameca splendens TaxID=208324 RepID=A0ABV0ZTC5_9TELE
MIPKVDKLETITHVHKSLHKVVRNSGTMAALAQLEDITNGRSERERFFKRSAALDFLGQLFLSFTQSWPQCYRGKPGGTVQRRCQFQFSLRYGPFNRSFSEEAD